MSGLFRAIGKLFGGGYDEPPPAPTPAPTPAPKVEPPPVMPQVNDEEVKRAKRRSLAAQQARRGRQSTILTSADEAADTLG